MKILLLLLSINFSINVDWLDEMNVIITEINNKSILKKTKTQKTESEEVVTIKYKYRDYTKIELGGSGKYIDTFNYQYFSKGKLILADFNFLIADYMQKGANYPGRSKGEITEVRSFYKNENEGIRIKRTLDYYENSNIDSLMIDLQKKDFDTTLIGNDEYLITKRSFKKISKRI